MIMFRQKRKNISDKEMISRNGSSLAIVICVAALMLAFALAMTYTGGLLMARANRRQEQEQAYQLAQSFAGVLDEELKKYNDPNDTATPTNSFYAYAYKFLEGQYGEYDPDNPDQTIFHYTAGDLGGGAENQYGKIQVRMYKENNEELDDDMSGEIPGGQSPAAILSGKLQRYIFTVEVTAEIDGTSEREGTAYSYSKEYRQMATYNVHFSHNGTTIVWGDDNNWHRATSADDVYTVPDDGMIQYQYEDTEILKCEFEDAFGNTSMGD